MHRIIPMLYQFLQIHIKKQGQRCYFQLFFGEINTNTNKFGNEPEDNIETTIWVCCSMMWLTGNLVILSGMICVREQLKY